MTNLLMTTLGRRITLLMVLILLLAACTQPGGTPGTAALETATDSEAKSEQPALAAVTLAAGEKLRVATTTSIIGDVVAQIGGDQITLVTLIGPGIDPHSYTPTPQDLRTLSEVNVIFINGLHLEEGLEEILHDAGAPQVVVNAAVTPLASEELHADEAHADEAHADEAHADEAGADTEHADEHDHGPNDPHTWQNVTNVMQWVTTIEQSLSTLDPSNASVYQANAAAYQAELTTLEAEVRAQLETIPAEKRKLVTDHESFNYFAQAYGFTIVGSIIPSLSSMAATSAQDLAALQDQISAEGVPAIFVGTTVNPAIADQLANDLGIKVVPLYSDALSATDGPAATYLAFMRYNVNAIVTALDGQ